jgi:hypothetical protein
MELGCLHRKITINRTSVTSRYHDMVTWALGLVSRFFSESDKEKHQT